MDTSSVSDCKGRRERSSKAALRQALGGEARRVQSPPKWTRARKVYYAATVSAGKPATEAIQIALCITSRLGGGLLSLGSMRLSEVAQNSRPAAGFARLSRWQY